ncbi:MAG: hypothetical protein IKK93_06435 [Campylobacter sp.]|nr:hypothetical protein [Campylobacter sp.]
MPKITAVIPVRAGSRRLPNKNILPFGNSNLLVHKIRQLKQVKQISNIVVLTDSNTMIQMAIYDKAILKYQDCLKNGYDSLMSVTALKGFFWYENKPINYDRNTIKWPPTQDTMPLYEINSAVFIADSQIYKTKKDRIGQKPFLFETDKIKSIDIDWKEDFIMADILYKTLIKKDKEMYRGGVAALNNPKYAPQQDLCLRGAI